ncbi:MAG TPA: peptidylprolyl isomerase [Alphaproteobacteria bacterium]|nr:peptidylprolyl isomerase [Alphaproteobacteria bacterium]
MTRFSSLFLRPAAICVWLAIALMAAFGTASGQSLRIAAVVNDEVISVFDVNERVRLILFSANIPDSPEARRQIGPQVVRSLIDERLEMQEAKRLSISIDQAEYEDAVGRIESQNHIPRGKLPDMLSQNGISPTTLEAQLRAQLTWVRIVRRRAGTYANVSPEEVTEALDRMRDNMNKPSNLVAEIFLPVDAPTDEESVRANIERMRDQLTAGAGFVPLARQFSQSASAASGGDLGWIYQGQLDPELDRALEQMHPGELSQPIRTAGGYYLLLLRDRRAPAATGEPTLLLARAAFPAPPGGEIAAGETARRVTRGAPSCDAFAQAAEKQPGADVSQARARMSEMTPDLRAIITRLPVGGITEPLPMPGGTQVIMVCERQEAEAAALPPRSEVERMLQSDKLEAFSRRLLRDLRQSAFIDIRV